MGSIKPHNHIIPSQPTLTRWAFSCPIPGTTGRILSIHLFEHFGIQILNPQNRQKPLKLLKSSVQKKHPFNESTLLNFLCTLFRTYISEIRLKYFFDVLNGYILEQDTTITHIPTHKPGALNSGVRRDVN